MEKKKILLVLLGAGLAASARARPPVSVRLAAAAHADTEASTNVPLAAWEARLRRFAWRLSFDATPSNNVQAAFGRDADGDGVLSPDEEGLVVGWDCGEWFAVLGADGARLARADASPAGARTLDCAVGFRADGRAASLALAADGGPLFPPPAAPPPAAFHGAGWNLVRLTARGAGFPAGRLRAQTVPFGLSLVLR